MSKQEFQVPIEAIERAHREQKPFLGRAEDVKACLVYLLDQVFGKEGDGMELVDRAAKQFTAIFLGRNPLFVGSPAWNEPGGIDQYLKDALRIPEQDPDKIMWVFFARCVLALKALDDDPKADDDMLAGLVEGNLQNWSLALVGIDAAKMQDTPE